ncbi:hypothetical protein C8R45DRAFT_832275, partial [Mycena sanguinolenta]
GADNPYLNCGNDAQLAEDIVDVNPGDDMSFFWANVNLGLSRWPHSIGPMLTYMTACPDLQFIQSQMVQDCPGRTHPK